MFRLPSIEKKFLQEGVSDISGNIWSSFNIDLESKDGVLQVAPRILINTSSVAQANMGVPVGFAKASIGANNNWYCSSYKGTGDRIFVGTTVPSGPFVPDTATNTPGSAATQSGGVIAFQGRIFTPNGGSMRKLNDAGTAWTTLTAFDVGGGSPMVVFNGRLYYAYSSISIGSIDSSDAVSNPSGVPNTVAFATDIRNLPASIIKCFGATSSSMWIGASASEGEKGAVYQWNGSDVNVGAKYNINAQAPMAMVIKNDAPWIMDSNGSLQAFNGGSFAEKASLPVTQNQSLGNPMSITSRLFINAAGMVVRGESIFMLVNNLISDTGGTINENFPSGVWEYNEKFGLVHRGSVSRWVYLTSTVSDDYGQNRISVAGALVEAKTSDTTATTNGDFLIGAEYYTDSTATQSAVFITDTKNSVPKTGYVVTPKIFSEEVSSTWQKFSLQHKKLLDSTDKIVFKYRTTDEEPIELTGTWGNDGIIFTTATDMTGKEGYEIEGIQGVGSGMCGHIVTVVQGVETWAVTLDETFCSSNGTGKVRLQNWQKAGVISTQNTQTITKTLGVNSPYIWIKLFMMFKGEDEVNNLFLSDTIQESLK